MYPFKNLPDFVSTPQCTEQRQNGGNALTILISDPALKTYIIITFLRNLFCISMVWHTLKTLLCSVLCGTVVYWVNINDCRGNPERVAWDIWAHKLQEALQLGFAIAGKRSLTSRVDKEALCKGLSLSTCHSSQLSTRCRHADLCRVLNNMTKITVNGYCSLLGAARAATTMDRTLVLLLLETDGKPKTTCAWRALTQPAADQCRVSQAVSVLLVALQFQFLSLGN